MAFKEKITNETDWQSKLSSLQERMLYMFRDELLVDVTFIVDPNNEEKGNNKFSAHKLVLGSTSPVFYSMFYGELKEKSDVINIPDVTVDAFRCLLKHIYKDILELTVETAFSTLYASKKYCISSLSDICIDFLKSNLSTENVLLIFSNALQFDEDELAEICIKFIDEYAFEILNLSTFLDISYDALIFILKRETLNCSEVNIFNALVRWSLAECKRNGMKEDEITPSDQRNAVKDAIKLIRFPAMTVKEFANGPARSKLLTESEKNILFIRFNSSTSKPEVPFSLSPRRPVKFLPKLKACNTYSQLSRIQGLDYTLSNWLGFKVNKPIFIAGCGLFGPIEEGDVWFVEVKLTTSIDAQEYLAEISKPLTSNDEDYHLLVLFDYPIPVEAGKQYHFHVYIRKSSLTFDLGKNLLLRQTVHNFSANDTVEFNLTSLTERTAISEILFYNPIDKLDFKKVTEFTDNNYFPN